MSLGWGQILCFVPLVEGCVSGGADGGNGIGGCQMLCHVPVAFCWYNVGWSWFDGSFRSLTDGPPCPVLDFGWCILVVVWAKFARLSLSIEDVD